MVSNYPNGFANGVSILGLPVLNMVAGDIYWVNSAKGADKSGVKGTRDAPYKTIGYVIEQDIVKATNGDVILVAPNHSESITAGGITMDIAGVTIMGMGTGNQRPLIQFSAASSTILITADDCVIRNIVCEAGANTTVLGISVGTGVSGTTIDAVEFTDSSLTDTHFITPIKLIDTTENGNDDTVISNCKYVTEDVGALEFVEGASDLARFTMTGNYYETAGPDGATLFAPLTASDSYQHLWVADNYISSKATASTVNVLFEGGTATDNTGFIVRNTAAHIDTAGVVMVPATMGVWLDENFSNSVKGNTGAVLYPAADS